MCYIEFLKRKNELIELLLGKDKLWIILNFFGIDFGIMFSGDEMKLGNGGLLKGFVIFWDCIFFLMCFLMILGWFCVDLWFWGNGLMGDMYFNSGCLL